MTDPGSASDLASLEPLQPLDAIAPESAGPQGADEAANAQRSGLPAPAYNVYCRDKTFYRFLFAGVVMLVGALMPYGAEPGRALYQTASGGFYVLLGIAMIWTWWGAIANNRSTSASLKWLLLCMAPLVAGIWGLVSFDAQAALATATENGWIKGSGLAASEGVGGLFGDMFGGLAQRDAEKLARAELFWRLYGTGNFYVMVGALLAEIGFLGGIVGGAKQNKNEMKQKMMAAAERRRR